MKKYKLTSESIHHAGSTLYRIKRLSDGLLGGYVESEKNLSQIGSCFIYNNAKVCGEARVYGKANVCGEADVFGNAVATGLVQNAILLKHNVTMTDNYIAIGCENHPIKHWAKNIDEIGRKNGYTEQEIKAYRHVLKGMLMLRKGSGK